MAAENHPVRAAGRRRFTRKTAPVPRRQDEWVLAVEYLPGQFDQRADSCAQCIQLSTCKERPEVRTARVYYIKGKLSDERTA